jgi:hypothetical protein
MTAVQQLWIPSFFFFLSVIVNHRASIPDTINPIVFVRASHHLNYPELYHPQKCHHRRYIANFPKTENHWIELLVAIEVSRQDRI